MHKHGFGQQVNPSEAQKGARRLHSLLLAVPSPQRNVRSCALCPEDERYCMAGDPQICPGCTSFFNLFFLSTLRAGDDTLGSLPFYPVSFRPPLRSFLKSILICVIS